MLDIGWSEMLVIVVVAIIVIGPRDLPGVLRTVGRWIGKVRSLSREFQRNLNDIARETEIDEVQRTIRETTNLGSVGGKPGPITSSTTAATSDLEAGAAPAPSTAPEGEEAKPTESARAAAGSKTSEAPIPPAAGTEG